MPEQPTDKSKYKSPTTGEYYTAGQYIAEIVTVRQAQKEGGVDLRYKFWNHKPWTNKYRYNVTEAYKLLKKYRAKAIIDGLMEFKWAYSLKVKKLVQFIQKRDKELAAIEKNLEKTTPLKVNKVTESVPRRARTGKKSMFSLLKESDNDRREKEEKGKQKGKQ